MHKSINIDRAMDAVVRQMTGHDSPGFCLDCGEEQEGCEPDMRGGTCECCGEAFVYGAEEILGMLGG